MSWVMAPCRIAHPRSAAHAVRWMRPPSKDLHAHALVALLQDKEGAVRRAAVGAMCHMSPDVQKEVKWTLVALSGDQPLMHVRRAFRSATTRMCAEVRNTTARFIGALEQLTHQDAQERGTPLALL